MPPRQASRPSTGIQIERERLGEASLIFFLNDRLGPVLEQIEATDPSSGIRTNFLQAELLESFLWLHLGVQIDYFPRPLARRAIYEYFPTFLKAYDSTASGPSFETWFTSPIRAIWESEFTGKQELFSFGRTWDQATSPETTSIFQTFLIPANGFAQNVEARPLVQAIVISKESEWAEAVEKNKPIAAFLPSAREDQEALLKTHWAFPGYFAEVDYLRATRQINAEIHETQQKTTHEFEDYLRRLKEIQQWRLNFGDATYRARFIRIGQMAAENCVQYAPPEELGDSQSVVKKFLAEIYDLMTDWGAPRAMAAGRGGAA